MVMTDPIADFLSRIRNANKALHSSVDIPISKLKEKLACILLDEGYIKDFKVVNSRKESKIRVFMKYKGESERVIKGIKRISRPGLRIYAKRDEVPKVLGGLGIAIISTSSGLMTDRVARKTGVGGEVVAYVW
ncbi:30S ribosomal protein S8 [bacterium]|nr:30S ribosomal protein S8 [bacterium]